jgi:hypothetical protein
MQTMSNPPKNSAVKPTRPKPVSLTGISSGQVKHVEGVVCPSMACACRKPKEWTDYDKLPSYVSATASAYIGCPVLICSIQDVITELAYINSRSYVGKILAREGLRYSIGLTYAQFRCATAARFQSAAQPNKRIRVGKSGSR